MIRFRCGHCGNRIVVHKRHLGTLITCPDCAATTHPVAQQVDRRESRGKILAAPSAVARQSCANCAHPIGQLQRLELWDNKVVCAPCHRKLSDESALIARLPAPIATTQVAVARRENRIVIENPDTSVDPLFQSLTRPFRGGLFGAMVGLCVAAAALYGAMSLLKDVAGVVTGLAIGGLALLAIYVGVRWALTARRDPAPAQPQQRALDVNRTPVG